MAFPNGRMRSVSNDEGLRKHIPEIKLHDQQKKEPQDSPKKYLWVVSGEIAPFEDVSRAEVLRGLAKYPSFYKSNFEIPILNSKGRRGTST